MRSWAGTPFPSPPEQAADRIAGFLILCDWSARDLQFHEMDGSLGPFKGKDFGSSLGPVFVTPDELSGYRTGTGYDLEMTATRQRPGLRP